MVDRRNRNYRRQGRRNGRGDGKRDSGVIETPNRQDYESFTIVDGTPVHVLDASSPGPTAVVTGGVHGSEYGGIRTAWEITEWELESSTLVIISKANVVAADQGTYTSSTGDLNQQFPTGREPTTAHSRVVWNDITNYDADVVIDLHTSRGIYGTGGPSYGLL